MSVLLTTLFGLFGLWPAELPVTTMEVVAVELVQIPVVVRGPSGIVRGLQPEDFELLVDGRAAPIELFDHRADAPIRLVLLQDLSGSMANHGRLEASREVVRFFLERALPSDEMAIATFAERQARVEVPFTRDQQTLEEAISSWEPYGVTALHDAVARLPEISGSRGAAGRAAVLLTDGADNASLFEPAQAREIVRRAELPVYVFSLDPRSSRNGAELGRYEGLLRTLAASSGGRYYEVGGPGDWKEAAMDVARALRSRYVIAFNASGEGERKHHELTVKVRGRRREVTARSGYRGTLPAAWTDRD